jgi:hypothetical protein
MLELVNMGIVLLSGRSKTMKTCVMCQLDTINPEYDLRKPCQHRTPKFKRKGATRMDIIYELLALPPADISHIIQATVFLFVLGMASIILSEKVRRS